MPASDQEIADRAVERGFLSQEQLDACRVERRQMLKDGLEITVRELLFDHGLIDSARWKELERPPDETVAETDPVPPASDEAPVVREEQEVLGGYRIVSELGRGAMGIVYEAVQEKLNRRVALKVLPETQALQGVARERFLREAQATASLNHPGIVQIFDIAEDRGIHFFAMELLEGCSLKQVLEEKGRLPCNEAARIARDCAVALEYAHENGVIHRDVKPDNIILRDDGTVVLTDFGLARQTGHHTLTREGTIVGTPLYMAPEQARGDGVEVDHRADIYGLGISLYELLAGRVPFDTARDTSVLLDMVTHSPPPSLRRLAPHVPGALCAIVEVALEKDPAGRFQTARGMADDLGRFLRGESIVARPPSTLLRTWRVVRARGRQLAVAAVLGTLVALLGVMLYQLSLRWRADTLVLESISLSQSGQREEAREQLGQALELWPGLPEALFRQGELDLQDGQTERALGAFQAALERDPEHVEALLARAGVFRRAGQLDRAMSDFQRGRLLASGTDPRPALGGGAALYEAGKRDEARDWLRSGLELARASQATRLPGYSEAVHLLGELELEAGNVGAALGELEEAVRLHPSGVEPRILLARALLENGNTQSSVEAASAALRRDMGNLRARELRGLAYREMGLFPEAMADLDAAVELPSARFARGLCRFEALDVRADLKKAAEFFDYASAREDLEAVTEEEGLSAEQRGLAHCVLGWLRMLEPNAKRSPALREFERAVELTPGSCFARLSRGFLFLEWGRLDEAEADFLAARELTGGGYAARVGVGRVTLARGDAAAARAIFEEAVALAPDRVSAHAWLYRLALRRDDPTGAAQARARALAAPGPPPPAVRITPSCDVLQLAEQSAHMGFSLFALAVTQGSVAGRHLARAGAWMHRALAFDPWSLSASARYASVTYLLARVEVSEKAWARAREVDPQLVEAGLMRGVIQRDLLEGGSPKMAEVTLRRALKDAPADRPDLQGTIRYELAKTLLARDRDEDALELLDQALHYTPNRYSLAALRARLHVRLERPNADEAINQASRLFQEGERDKVRGALYTYAGDRLRDLGDDEKADHFLTRAIEADPRNAQPWRLRARIRLKGDPSMISRGFVDTYVAAELDPRYTRRFLEIEARLSRFRPILQHLSDRIDVMTSESPELPASAFIGGYMRFHQGDAAKAEALFDRSFKLSLGTSYFSLTYRGAARMRQGRHEEAMRDFESADKIFQGSPVTAFFKACLLAKLGKREEAISILEAQARRGYLFEGHIDNAPELSEIRSDPRMIKLFGRGGILNR